MYEKGRLVHTLNESGVSSYKMSHSLGVFRSTRIARARRSGHVHDLEMAVFTHCDVSFGKRIVVTYA